MIWLTVRYGVWAATLSVLVINTGAALLTLPAPSPLLGLELATVQFCLLAVSQTALLLGATISRRFQAYVQIQSLARRERLLNQISRSLNSTLDPNQVLQDIVQCTGQYFRVDRVVLWRLGTNEVIAVSEWRLNLQVPTMLGTHSSLADWFGQRDTDDDLWQHEPFQAQDYAAFQHPPARAALIEQSQLRSILRVPIFIRNQFFGSLSLHTTVTYRIFTSEEVSSLEQIAEQVAIALYNAQSYEQLERLVQERTQELEDERLVSESANRAKTEFLANMSHELRTPLTSILGFSSVLLQQVFGPLNQRQQEYLTTVHSSGEHLLELINDVLDLARIEAGKEELTIELVSVEDLCRACMSLIDAQSRHQGLDLNLDIAPDATICHADLRRLRQILVNLLSNAVKFTEAGSVTLRVSRTGDGLDFDVIDTGIGIAATDQTRLFQPFQQLDSGLNRRYQGSGLGLALAQRLARLHEGEITLQSELGRGSCFTLHLPDRSP
ncbi:GAF domain-containing protein, partial [Leptolyngbya sp. FACHB-36]|uniref:GAF domain-containing sensor histidine kinase n=1 Tax=Leptolyngbya sp. FACHB-36 TaxID=2692808 RepID=UPI0016816480